MKLYSWNTGRPLKPGVLTWSERSPPLSFLSPPTPPLTFALFFSSTHWLFLPSQVLIKDICKFFPEDEPNCPPSPKPRFWLERLWLCMDEVTTLVPVNCGQKRGSYGQDVAALNFAPAYGRVRQIPDKEVMGLKPNCCLDTWAQKQFLQTLKKM